MKSESADDDLAIADRDAALRLRARREAHLLEVGPRQLLRATLVANDPALDEVARIDAARLQECGEVPVQLAIGRLRCRLRIEILALDDRSELVVGVDAHATT